MTINDRPMAADEAVFIVNADGRTCQIVGGKNRTFDDGYTYTLTQDGSAVFQVGEEGLIDGEFDSHPSADAIEAIINAHRPAASHRP